MRIYRAAVVIPVNRPPIVNGAVTVEDGWIRSVEKFSANDRVPNVIDLGDVALVPALVNAHTHLEFSHLSHPLGQTGIEFTDWIRLVMQTRRNQLDQAEKVAAIQAGLQESTAGGVGYVGEISTGPFELSTYANSNFKRKSAANEAEFEPPINLMAGTMFAEQLGRRKTQFAEKVSTVDTFARNSPQNDFCAGISPHAPYSVHPELLRKIVACANQTGVPLAMHLAETLAERELLDHQTGPFVDLLLELGVWDRETFLPPVSILGYLKILAQAPRSLVIHGNYLTDVEIEFISRQSERMSVVFCPRTHVFFGHADYPLRELLKSQINVAVGTDSRASNPDLNLLEELKYIWRQFDWLSPLEVLQMGTWNGARSLGVDEQFGAIEVGKQARLSAIESDHYSIENFDWLFSESARCYRV